MRKWYTSYRLLNHPKGFHSKDSALSEILLDIIIFYYILEKSSIKSCWNPSLKLNWSCSWKQQVFEYFLPFVSSHTQWLYLHYQVKMHSSSGFVEPNNWSWGSSIHIIDTTFGWWLRWGSFSMVPQTSCSGLGMLLENVFCFSFI